MVWTPIREAETRHKTDCDSEARTAQTHVGSHAGSESFEVRVRARQERLGRRLIC